jgi:hypothetical protein
MPVILNPDFVFMNEVTTVTVQPCTSKAKQWFEKHVQTEPWQWNNGVLVVDPRYAPVLREAVKAQGFVVAGRD